MKIREFLDATLEGAAVLDPEQLDGAIIGVAERCGMDPVVCYDREKVINILAKGMSREEAEEWFEFNTLGAWLGDGTPIFVTRLPKGLKK